MPYTEHRPYEGKNGVLITTRPPKMSYCTTCERKTTHDHSHNTPYGGKVYVCRDCGATKEDK